MKNISLFQYSTAILILVLGFLGFRYYSVNKNLDQTENTLKETNEHLESAKSQNEVLLQELNKFKNISDSFAGQIASITDKVTGFAKLQETDKELLEKYSKVFFLNENYIPKEVALVDPKYTFKGHEEYFHTKLLPFLVNLMNAAEAEKIPLQIISGYRSFETQSELKSSYTVTYGSGANQFSADQGYSEHQLGTTIDFTTPSIGATFSGFSKTATYKWLTENAYKYGFVLSYPPNNKFYQFEPWHWRFVGVELATYLKNTSKYFYDLDQRQIDEYLIKFFNPN